MKKGITFTNLASIQQLNKAATEGIYADTPTNRKLGRVGMSYKVAKEKEENKEKGENKNLNKKEKINNIKELCEKFNFEIKKGKKEYGTQDRIYIKFNIYNSLYINPSAKNNQVTYFFNDSISSKSKTFDLDKEEDFQEILSIIKEESEGTPMQNFKKNKELLSESEEDNKKERTHFYKRPSRLGK